MNRDELCDRFIESVPYELYPVQEEALLAWFGGDESLMVCAPTGMGKTLIAEAAVFEALHTRRRIYYTTPLIALTEQKFRELREKAQAWGFARDDVGFITGNRRENPDALVCVVVAEILLNHLLASGRTALAAAAAAPGAAGDRPLPDGVAGAVDLGIDFERAGAVVMDEFHNFNDPDRGVVWELSLIMLPPSVRALLLSATVGNPYEFADWLQKRHGRRVTVVASADRRVPLEYEWVPDRLLTELLPALAEGDDAQRRTPALVFCFNRDECWELAERLKGLALLPAHARPQIEQFLDARREELAEGVGPKLRQMLIRGVGVHHAGVLPRHKEIVEELFNRKLVPYVVCTETLAAGVNLPARSVVLTTLLKGKPGERRVIPASAAHQMFGRAGRPQFDTRGYVYAVAHEDDVRIEKWRRRYEQIDPNSKDPGLLRARKELERKRPTRRRTEQYWSEGQFRALIQAGPAKLYSRSMIPYSVLIYLLMRTGTLHDVRRLLESRFAGAERIEKFQQQLDHMIGNLAALGYLERSADGDHVRLHESIFRLANYRSVDPLYGEFLSTELAPASFDEKLLALESVLEVPLRVLFHVRIPDDLPPGPLQTQVLEPLLIQMGVVLGRPGAEGTDEADARAPVAADDDAWSGEPLSPRPPTFPEMLQLVFEKRLAAPEPVLVQPKWIAGAAFEMDCEFFRFVRSRDLIKQEGLILRHLLRLVILAGEFFARTGDPDYQRVAELATRTCQRVDPAYTDRFLASAAELRTAAVR